jgi:hypothetical protein
VEVWATASLLTHVTVPPALIVTGFGEYAVVVRFDEPATIDTVVPVGLGLLGLSSLQATAALRHRAANTRLRGIGAPFMGIGAPFMGDVRTLQ